MAKAGRIRKYVVGNSEVPDGVSVIRNWVLGTLFHLPVDDRVIYVEGAGPSEEAADPVFKWYASGTQVACLWSATPEYVREWLTNQ